RARRSAPSAQALARRATRRLGARRLLPLERQLERLLTLLAPGVELVRFLTRFPGAFRLLFVAREPVGAPQLVIRLDEIGPELERLLEKGLSVFVHLALQVDEPEVEVRVQGRLLVVRSEEHTSELQSP